MEKEILLRVSKGDEQAFHQLYNLYNKKIFSIAWKLTGIESAAEDVVQDVFIKLWLHREKLSGINYFTAYLNTITRNHIFNSLRKIAHEDILLRDLLQKGEPVEKDGFDVVVYNQLFILTLNKLTTY